MRQADRPILAIKNFFIDQKKYLGNDMNPYE